MRLTSIVCGLALAASTAATSWGSVSYSYVADQTAYTGATGSQVQVTLSLLETLTGGSTSVITADGGLNTAGAAVNAATTTGGTSAAITPGSFTVPATFGGPQTIDYNQPSGTGNNLEINESRSTTGASLQPVGGLIPLGVLNITVGTGITTYNLTSLFDDTIAGSNSDLGQTNGNTITKNNDDLDVTKAGVYTGANSAAAFTFTVGPASVPEPTSLALVALGATAMVRRRR